MTGKILKGIGGFYYVQCIEDGNLYECRARGKFRKNEIKPQIGDNVEFEPTGEELKGSVINIFERKNSFIRPPVSNIDQMAIVSALKNPEPDTMFIDKMLAVLKSVNTPAIICFNKLDIADKALTDELKNIYEKAGYKVFVLSTKTGEGTDAFKEAIRGKTTAFAGFSGVGKSSLLNALCDCFMLDTGDVSQKLKRGKHTTRHVEIFNAVNVSQDTFIADTPGFSMLEIPQDVTHENLKDLFVDFLDFECNCKFTGCQHNSNKFCGVWDAVCENKIPKSRYDNYLTLYNELKDRKKW